MDITMGVVVGAAATIAAMATMVAATTAAVLASASTWDSNPDGTTSRQMPQPGWGIFLCRSSSGELRTRIAEPRRGTPGQVAHRRDISRLADRSARQRSVH